MLWFEGDWVHGRNTKWVSSTTDCIRKFAIKQHWAAAYKRTIFIILIIISDSEKAFVLSVDNTIIIIVIRVLVGMHHPHTHQKGIKAISYNITTHTHTETQNTERTSSHALTCVMTLLAAFEFTSHKRWWSNREYVLLLRKMFCLYQKPDREIRQLKKLIF